MKWNSPHTVLSDFDWPNTLPGDESDANGGEQLLDHVLHHALLNRQST